MSLLCSDTDTYCSFYAVRKNMFYREGEKLLWNKETLLNWTVYHHALGNIDRKPGENHPCDQPGVQRKVQAGLKM